MNFERKKYGKRTNDASTGCWLRQGSQQAEGGFHEGENGRQLHPKAQKHDKSQNKRKPKARSSKQTLIFVTIKFQG